MELAAVELVAVVAELVVVELAVAELAVVVEVAPNHSQSRGLSPSLNSPHSSSATSNRCKLGVVELMQIPSSFMRGCYSQVLNRASPV